MLLKGGALKNFVWTLDTELLVLLCPPYSIPYHSYSGLSARGFVHEGRKKISISAASAVLCTVLCSGLFSVLLW